MAFFMIFLVIDKNLIISEGNRPFWQIIVATLCYTLAAILLAMFFFGYQPLSEQSINATRDFSFLYIGVLCISQGILFSVVKNLHFDLGNRKMKEEYQVGPIKTGKWRNLPDIEYVSVFRQPKADGSFIFEANLWYKGNKHFNIYQNTHKDTVMLMGTNVAKILRLRLWDATVPQQGHWVELENI